MMASKTNIRILLKAKPTSGNKELLDFLHRNVDKLKRFYNIHVSIVNKADHKLPAMVVDTETIVGYNTITNWLKDQYVTFSKKSAEPKDDDSIMRDYISKQLDAGDNDSEDRSGDIAKKLANEAFRQREAGAKPPKKPIKGNVSKSTLAPIKENKPSEMEHDPMMAKYWENQGM